MIQLATKKNANWILALLRSVSASSLSFAGFKDSGAQGLRSLVWAWKALLRSVSASSLSFAGFTDSEVMKLMGGLRQHEPHTT
jgi:hypothetical protein